MNINPIKIKNVLVYPFKDMQSLIDYSVDKKKLLLSLNAEIIMKAEDDVAEIINNNISPLMTYIESSIRNNNSLKM